MSRAIFRKIIAAICLTSLVTVFASSLTKQVLANDSNEVREGVPGRRVGGGTRSGSTIASISPIAIAPENNEGLTTLQNPTFFFYVSKMPSPKMAEFVLTDENGETVYEQKMTLDGNSGVVGISNLADDKMKSLEVGKNYRWYFAVVPNPDDRAQDIYVTGWIKRVQPSTEVVSQLKDSDPLERAAVYQTNNIWYDAVATLADLLRSRPNDPAVAAKWKELLQSVKLDENISQQPFLQNGVSVNQPTVVGSEPN